MYTNFRKNMIISIYIDTNPLNTQLYDHKFNLVNTTFLQLKNAI